MRCACPGAAPAALLAMVALALAVAPAPADANTPAQGAVRGVAHIDVAEAALTQLGPVVVFLAPLDADGLPPAVPDPVKIRQKNARFLPDFRVVVVGQRVDMPNADTIYHNVFSFSKPNDFDLGLYPKGDSKSVTFSHAGVVKAYCSIHESMSATILVVPNAHFDVVGRTGAFQIAAVEPGRYTLHAWSERLPPIQREVEVVAGHALEIDLPLVDLGR